MDGSVQMYDKQSGRVWVLFSCMPRGNAIKTKDRSVACCQDGKYGLLCVSYVITQTKKQFFLFYTPFHQMCVKCHYSSLILVASKSVQPFIIKSYLNLFPFRLFFFLLPPHPSMCWVYTETENLRRIKRSLRWQDFVWWVMSRTSFFVFNVF